MPHKFTSWVSLQARLRENALGGSERSVLRGMATLALGSGAGRLVGIAAIPILTRLYGPEDFGVLAVFTAFVALLSPLVSLRYALVIPLCRRDGTAINAMVLSAILILLLTALTAILLWAGGSPLLRLISMEGLATWWWLIALGVLGSASYELLTMWATRQRAYITIAHSEVAQSLAGAAIKVALGFLALKPLGLLAGQVVAQAGGIGTLWRSFFSDFCANRRHVRWSRISKIAWRFRGFPIYRVPSQFLMVFAMQAPLLFVSALYDARTTGQLGLALTALMLPLNLFGQSAGKALYAEAAKLYKRSPQEVSRMAKQVQWRLLLLSAVPAIILFFLGPQIFAFAFGREWIMSGRFASTLSIALIFQFTSSPLMQLINLVTQQSFFLLINAMRVLGLLGIFGLAKLLSLSSADFVLFYSVFMAIFYIMSSLVVIRILSKSSLK